MNFREQFREKRIFLVCSAVKLSYHTPCSIMLGLGSALALLFSIATVLEVHKRSYYNIATCIAIFKKW